MTEREQVYRCAICGNIVEVKHAAGGELVCCGQPMKLLAANTEDAATEKHVPVVEQKDNIVIVTVGAVEHPMTMEHYIEWIEVVTKDETHTVFLAPGDAPRAEFCISAEIVGVYAYCNLHGLWKV